MGSASRELSTWGRLSSSYLGEFGAGGTFASFFSFFWSQHAPARREKHGTRTDQIWYIGLASEFIQVFPLPHLENPNEPIGQASTLLAFCFIKLFADVALQALVYAKDTVGSQQPSTLPLGADILVGTDVERYTIACRE